MDDPRQLADRLESAATAISVGAAALDGVRADPGQLGEDAAGRPGEIGRVLHAQWSAALSARTREAGRAGARLVEAAAGLRRATQAYAAADGAAHDRLRRRGA